MHVIVKVAFFETHMIDVRCKPVCLRCIMMCHNGKEMKFKLIRTPMVGGPKLNLVLMDQIKKKVSIMVVAQLEQLQGTHGEARKDGPPPNHICEMLVRYKDVFTNVLLKMLPPRSGKQLCSTRY